LFELFFSIIIRIPPRSVCHASPTGMERRYTKEEA
jgi:hypothetical protein